MRILVLQLARFGDIYQTRPVVNALRRAHPDCELHILVRERFRDALAGQEAVTVHALPTREILRPIFESDSESESHSKLLEFVEGLSAFEFDKVINLSFSPLSSFLTDWIARPGADVRGYTRHSDGHFTVPDDTSAYFYAQVGIGRPNRYHLTDIFAAVAGVDLSDTDFDVFSPVNERSGIAVHLGASEKSKIYPPELWIKALRLMMSAGLGPITLIGSYDERPLSETIISNLGSGEIHNRVGGTTLTELAALIAESRLVMGADSAPIHIADLSGTPVLNVSCASVNFWETGPLAAGSRVVYSERLETLDPADIAAQAHSMLNGTPPPTPCAVREKRETPYTLHGIGFDSFAWRLIEALYTGAPFPPAECEEDRLAFQRLFELTELALQQIGNWNGPGRETAAKILEQVDTMLEEVGRINPRVAPAVRWFQTQRLRIPPGTEPEILERTQTAFQELYWVCAVYHSGQVTSEDVAIAVRLSRQCAAEAYECNFGAAESAYQELLSTIHTLSRDSTKVAPQGWSSVLGELQSALERRDFIQLGDLLQHTVPSLIS